MKEENTEETKVIIPIEELLLDGLEIIGSGDFMKLYPGIRQNSIQYAMKKGRIDYVKIDGEHFIVMTELTKAYNPVFYKGSKRCKGQKKEGLIVKYHATGGEMPVSEVFKKGVILHRRGTFIKKYHPQATDSHIQWAQNNGKIAITMVGRKRIIVMNELTKSLEFNHYPSKK